MGEPVDSDSSSATMFRVRAFLDTNILKYAVDERLVFQSRVKRIRWGDITEDVVVHDRVVQYPNRKLHGRTFDETLLLPFIAYLAMRQRLELLSHSELLLELWGLPRTNDPRGGFYGAPITMVKDPLPYGRVVLGQLPETPLPQLSFTKPLAEAKRRQVAFIAGLTQPRLLALRKACNADGEAGINANQLIDAFLIWCAETAGATHFVTAEKALLQLRANAELALRCRPVMPSELVAEILPSRIRRAVERFRYAVHRKRYPKHWHVAA